MAVKFRVQHLTHLGSVISTHTPVGGTLSYGFKANEVGDIAYQVAQEELVRLQLPANSFAPYKTDWRLQQQVSGGSWTNIHAGIHVPVNLVNDQDAVNVAGKDWAHWLDQPVWFDFYNYHWDTIGNGIDEMINSDHALSGAVNGVVNKPAVLAFIPGCSQETMLRTLITNTKRGTDYVNISAVFSGNVGNLQLTVDPYIIGFEDTSTVLQHINNIAALSDPFGFDWTMNASKKMEFFGPRKIVENAPDPIWTITKDSILEQPILDLNWTNNGPIGTYIVGMSIGSPALWHHKRDQDSEALYRQWLKLENVGDRYWKGPAIKHAVDGLQYIHPHKDITITVLPEVLDPYEGFRNHVGDVVRLKWDFPPYHEVNAYYWITDQHFMSDPSGNWKCDLGLQQIYGTTTLGG